MLPYKEISQNNIEYTVLAPLPGTTITECQPGATDCKASIKSYIPGMFNLIIGIAAVFAVGWIIWGGVEYITTDSWMGKEAGKKRIWHAIWGLVIVIGAWLILFTINPKLLTFDLNVVSSTVKSPLAVTAGVSMTTQQINDSNAIRTSLQLEGILTNNGPCSQGQTTGCTNLNGLPNIALDGLAVLANTLKCTASSPCLTITGGTEGGHQTHGVGIPIVDLAASSNLNQYLGYPSPADGTRVTKVYKVSGQPDITATFVYETTGGNPSGTSTGDHWHVIFS